MLLQLCLGIPSSLEHAAGLGGRGMAVLAFPRVVIGSGPYSGFSSAGAVVFTQWRDLLCRPGESTVQKRLVVLHGSLVLGYGLA